MTAPLGEHTDAERCPAVQFSCWGVVRCTKQVGHVEWHSGSGRLIDEDGEPDVFGSAWRYQLALAAS